jgi:hypothetical protein
MDFRDALNTAIAELTPQPWDYTTNDGTTLTVIPSGIRHDPGCAEVMIRVTASKTQAAEAAITTTDLPTLIAVLGEPVTAAWEHTAHWPDGTPKGGIGTWLGDSYGLTLAPADDGFTLAVAEDTGDRVETASITLPDAQRLPLASALSRALDVARGWES